MHSHTLLAHIEQALQLSVFVSSPGPELEISIFRRVRYCCPQGSLGNIMWWWVWITCEVVLVEILSPFSVLTRRKHRLWGLLLQTFLAKGVDGNDLNVSDRLWDRHHLDALQTSMPHWRHYSVFNLLRRIVQLRHLACMRGIVHLELHWVPWLLRYHAYCWSRFIFVALV